MSIEKQKVILINGSPKPNKDTSASEQLINMQDTIMKAQAFDIYKVNARHSLIKDNAADDFTAIHQANAIIFTFPLYVFCLPGVLTQYIQDYYQFWLEKPVEMRQVKIYAVVNCGFSEFDINEDAVRVIQSFSRQIGAEFRFGVLIGGGGMLLGSSNSPYMKKTNAAVENAFALITQDILTDSTDPVYNISIPLNIPRRMYYFVANMGWGTQAKKYGLKKKDLYKKPYYSN